jgi:hypothetical protein
MKKSAIKKLITLRNYLVYRKFDLISKINHSKLLTNPEADFVVSIASYPKRSHLLPGVFEALNNQTTVPKKWILVLSIEEWPELKLPFHLEKLINRGLEIIWVQNNPYSVKKLVPIIAKYPEYRVITFDDELIYGKFMIEKLIKCSLKHPKAIIGHVGKQLIQINGELKMFYRTKEGANFKTPSEQVYFLGGAGTLYPANSLDSKISDMEAIHKIVPGRGSDIWFWAAAVANGTEQICLGTKKDVNLYFAVPSTKSTKPKDTPGVEIMEERFKMAIDFFKIREKLLTNLPNY